MNQSLIDNSILVLSVVIAAFVVRYSTRRIAPAVGAFFILFSPLVIFVNMWAHLLAVSIMNYQRYKAGFFQYDFRFYGLMLLGVVFIVVSGINIHLARKRIKGEMLHVRFMHWLNLGTAVLFIPAIPLNPISTLPVIASAASSLTLLLMRPFSSKLLYDREEVKGRNVSMLQATGAMLKEAARDPEVVKQ
jgi:hypothetical protein